MLCNAIAAAWLSIFFENAFVSRVKRRMCIRIVRLLLSTNDVLICFESGSPFSCSFRADAFAGLCRFHRLRVRAIDFISSA